jgi:PAS domain-containing protein
MQTNQPNPPPVDILKISDIDLFLVPDVEPRAEQLAEQQTEHKNAKRFEYEYVRKNRNGREVRVKTAYIYVPNREFRDAKRKVNQIKEITAKAVIAAFKNTTEEKAAGELSDQICSVLQAYSAQQQKK